MAGKPVEFHPEAIAEAEAAVDWYLHRSRRAAEGFILELERAVDAITKGPERWPIFQGNFRRHPLRRFRKSWVSSLDTRRATQVPPFDTRPS